MTTARTADGWGKRNGQRWSKEETGKLVRLRGTQRWPWDRIAREFPGRTLHCLQSRYHYFTRGAHSEAEARDPNRGTKLEYTPEMRQAVQRAKDIRCRAQPHESIVAAICGDPPPGRSALDRMNERKTKVISLADMRHAATLPDRTNESLAPEVM